MNTAGIARGLCRDCQADPGDSQICPACGGRRILRHAELFSLHVAHVDCDTIPFLWQLADRFTLMDNFHQTTVGPSTPNAIAMVAGQTGETQWALHPDKTGKNLADGQQIPNVNDSPP